MKTDARKECLESRLSMLTTAERERLKRDIDRCCFDTFNYDASSGKFCVLAVALNIHNTVKKPTQEKVHSILGQRFQPVNAMKGLEGNFYRDNRKQDVLTILARIKEVEG